MKGAASSCRLVLGQEVCVCLGRSALTCQGFGQLLEESSTHFLLLLEAGAEQPARQSPEASGQLLGQDSPPAPESAGPSHSALARLLRGSRGSDPDCIFSSSEALGGEGGPASGEGTRPKGILCRWLQWDSTCWWPEAGRNRGQGVCRAGSGPLLGVGILSVIWSPGRMEHALWGMAGGLHPGLGDLGEQGVL